MSVFTGSVHWSWRALLCLKKPKNGLSFDELSPFFNAMYSAGEGLAQMAQAAPGAVRLPGLAHRPAMEHDTVAEGGGVLRGQYLSKLHLYLHRVLQIVHQAQAVGDTDAVGVHHRGAGDLEQRPPE